MTSPALLDVSVLIALFDLAHVHHEVAHDWFADNHDRGWATSPLTENALTDAALPTPTMAPQFYHLTVSTAVRR